MIDVPATPERHDPVTVTVDEEDRESPLVFRRGESGTTFDLEFTDERIFLKVDGRFVIQKDIDDFSILVLAPKGTQPERAFLAFKQIPNPET